MAGSNVGEDFFAAWTTKDFDRARTLLKDDLHFERPIDTFDDADSYRISGGKIAWMTVVFDARPFAPLFEAQSH